MVSAIPWLSCWRYSRQVERGRVDGLTRSVHADLLHDAVHCDSAFHHCRAAYISTGLGAKELTILVIILAGLLGFSVTWNLLLFFTMMQMSKKVNDFKRKHGIEEDAFK